MIVTDMRAMAEDALQEMEELLRAVASSTTPHRLSAVRYTHCREALLGSQFRPAVPGFLIQCVSIYKFHDFINLYDPKAEARLAFVETAFGKCRALLDSKRVYDVFSDDF
jgi:hypothetical protein